jgi:glycosyltransferase involved in cell wall biosynthesis
MRHLVVIPAYNEEEALPGTVARLQELPDGFELLVVDDGSTDRTGPIAEQLVASSRVPLHVLHLPMNSGIGVAVQTGYLFAAQRGGYDYVIQLDADGQHDPASIPALVNDCATQGLDLCVGSRFLAAQEGGYQSTFARRVGIRFFSWLIRRFSGMQLTDPTSGFRCAGPRAWRRFARDYPDDYPEPESLFWCARNRLRIGEVPVRMRPRQGGLSSIRPGGSVYYMLKVSLAILLDKLRARGE